MLFVCLLELMLYVPVNNVTVISGIFLVPKQRVKYNETPDLHKNAAVGKFDAHMKFISLFHFRVLCATCFYLISRVCDEER